MSIPVQNTALVLSGGGARAAYQVGVLKGIAQLVPKGSPNPFPIICGTSAGAINAAGLAGYAGRYHVGVRRLESVWRHFHSEQIYRCDTWGMLRQSAGWLLSLFLGGRFHHRGSSLINGEPLGRLLERMISFDDIQHNIDNQQLRALSITASGYTSGDSVSFFQADASCQGWKRARRVGLPTHLTTDHLLASAALPILFPPVFLSREYFGVGSVRQVAPISPALHLGADKVLVVGVSSLGRAKLTPVPKRNVPTVGQIFAHMLDTRFSDSLSMDLERLQRINETLAKIPDRVKQSEGIGLKPVEVLVIAPEVDFDVVAMKYVDELPKPMRLMLKGSGALSREGSNLLSLLLFEQGYCRELIRLGYQDVLRREDEVAAFFNRSSPLEEEPLSKRGGVLQWLWS